MAGGEKHQQRHAQNIAKATPSFCVTIPQMINIWRAFFRESACWRFPSSARQALHHSDLPAPEGNAQAALLQAALCNRPPF